jgi:putative flavoprotein involved in K+ transport
MLEDGRALEVSNVIWSTGFRPGFQWIDLALPVNNGVPIHIRGIVESCPGLYFVGLPFLYSLSSVLLGGVGRDGEHIADYIVSTLSGRKGEVSGKTSPR